MIIKYIIIVLVILGVGGFLLYWFVFRKKDISLDFNLGGDLTNILSAVQSGLANPPQPNAKGLGIYLDVPLTTIVNNKSAAGIALQNMAGAISYNGDTVLQTNAGSAALQNVQVAAKTSKPVTDNVQVLINPSSVKFIGELIKGNKPSIKYNFGATVAGKPYSLTNTTTINK